MFRALKASEIDCRIQTVNSKGLSLLLYKDARCDMNILDETVGALNWMRRHTRDNANCIVAIWDDKKNQWIEKEDTGAESFTEKEKGIASDSFKRACFNWGIGRELYTAPRIWIPADRCDIKPTGRKDAKGNVIMTCYNHFCVGGIETDKDKNITKLTIWNTDTKTRVFCYDKTKKEQ